MLSGLVIAAPIWFLLLSYGSARWLGSIMRRRRKLIDCVAGIVFLAVAVSGVVLTVTG
jgi:arginine exporter protein ArgO